MPVYPRHLSVLQSPGWCTGNLNNAPVGSREGKFTQGCASYSTAHCWICCHPPVIHSEGKGKGRKKKEGICLPQTSAAKHHWSNLLEEFSIACSKDKLILLYNKNKKSTIKQFPKKHHYKNQGSSRSICCKRNKHLTSRMLQQHTFFSLLLVPYKIENTNSILKFYVSLLFG